MTIALVNKTQGTSAASPRAITIPSAGAGNLLVCTCCTSTDSGSAPTITAGWTQVPTATILSGTTRRATFFFKVAAGGETSVTCTQAGVTSLNLSVIEYSATKGWPATPYDQVAMVTAGSVSSLPSMAVTTLFASEVLVAFAALAAYTTPLMTNSFVVEDSDLNQAFTGDLIVAAAGSYSTVMSWTTARVACGGLVSFHENPSGSLIVPSRRIRPALFR